MKRKLLILSLVMMLIMSSILGCTSGDTNTSGNTEALENQTEATNEVEAEETDSTDEQTETEATEDQTAEAEYGDFGGYLWEVKNGDATVYLFGSVHLANDSLYPFNQTVEEAFASADVLGVEADVSDMAAIQAVAPLMMLEDPEDTVYNHLTEEGIEIFESACKELGINPAMLEKFRVWVVGSNLMSMQLMQSEFTGGEGVDMYFLNKAKAAGKEIDSVEGLEYQIRLINSFTDKEQEDTFFTLGSVEETTEDFQKLYDLYVQGDDAAMTEFLFKKDEEAFESDVEDKILRDRNINMAEKIDAMLKTDKTYFVVFGLAHFLGDESVNRYLEDKGYTVERK